MRYLTAFQTRASYCVPYPSDVQIISILKRNVREEFQLFLTLKNPKTFADAKRACKEKAELDARNAPKCNRDEKSRRSDKPQMRKVFSLETADGDMDSNEETEPTEFEVCYIQGDANAERLKKYRCFNCDRIGHLWRKCSDKITAPFCMYCGRKGVKISDCPNEKCKFFYRARAERRANRAQNLK